MPDPIEDLSRQLRSGDRPDYSAQTKKSKKSSGKRSGSQYETKKKQPVADVWISAVAQRWVDKAEGYGFSLPFDVNFFANRLHAKVRVDDRMQRLEESDRHQDVVRLLDKMTDMFWKHYIREGDVAGNVSNIYLDEVWEDVQDFALSSLRAAYLKKHGHARPQVEIRDHRETAYHQEMQRQRTQRWLEEALEQLTPERRAVLESAREKRQHEEITND